MRRRRRRGWWRCSSADASEVLACLATIREMDQPEADGGFVAPEVPPLDDPSTRYQQAAEFFRGFAASFRVTQAGLAERIAQSDAALRKAQEAAQRIAKSLGD